MLFAPQDASNTIVKAFCRCGFCIYKSLCSEKERNIPTRLSLPCKETQSSLSWCLIDEIRSFPFLKQSLCLKNCYVLIVMGLEPITLLGCREDQAESQGILWNDGRKRAVKWLLDKQLTTVCLRSLAEGIYKVRAITVPSSHNCCVY